MKSENLLLDANNYNFNLLDFDFARDNMIKNGKLKRPSRFVVVIRTPHYRDIERNILSGHRV